MTVKFSAAINHRICTLSIESRFLLFEQIIALSKYDCSIHLVLGSTLIIIPQTSSYSISGSDIRCLYEKLINGPFAFTDKPRVLFAGTETFSRTFKFDKS